MKANSNCFFLCFLLLFSPIHSFPESSNEKAEGEEIKRSDFPDGFFFGTATSSYQIEGAYLEDGKSLSNWDSYTHNQRAGSRNEANGDVANNHYHRFLEDVKIMDSLGVSAYRFSVSWARVLPRGRFGEVNPFGIMFYDQIINNLLLKGIEPFLTINHNDFPQELEDRYGSWLSPLMQEDFVHFAKICFESFGDRVKYWITINEPNLFATLAYTMGLFPPGHSSEPYDYFPNVNSTNEQFIAMHNMLLAHARTSKLYRDDFEEKQGGFIGIVAFASMYEPLTDDDLDREAASRALAFDVAWVFDPLVFGDYPQEMRRYLGNKLPSFSAEERECIKGSIDFIGVNHYRTLYAKDCLYSGCALKTNDDLVLGFSYLTTERNGVPIGEPTGMNGMPVVPRGMEEIIDYLKKRYYNMPMFVLENGYSQAQKDMQNSVHDVKRIEFHKAYLTYLARTIRNGADVRGYFIWSLMDDFEWLDGYSVEFGLYYIDRKTLKRTPKLSAKWYSNFLTNSSLRNKEMLSSRSSFRNHGNFLISGLKSQQAEI